MLKAATMPLAGVLALALAGCGQAEQEATPAAEPVTASPTPAPGVPQEELDARQAVSQLGTAARDLVDAEDLESAREALGTIEQRLTAQREELPENLASSLETQLEAAREAMATDDLAAAKAAGQAMINSVIGSEQIQDPTLVQPEGTGG